MEYLINLFILLPYILYLFQPFNINIFAPLKHTLIEEIDAIFQFNFNCILHANWISIFVQIKSQILISKNVFVG